MLRRLVLDKIAINVAAAQPEILVRADETSLNQIVLNLIVNARDAMPDGGTATIDLGVMTLREPLALTTRDHAGRIRQPQGIGHGPRHVRPMCSSHLFEPFYTTKASDQGTGLGLSIVYGIVKGLGGGIEVHSEVGRGADVHDLSAAGGR